MDLYYVNKNAQSNGTHEVHKASCTFLPATIYRKHLGYFKNCYEAVKEAKKTYPYSADGCHYCCPESDLR
jgi:hypothetical protein